MSRISVWVFKSEYDSYMQGDIALGWSVSGEYHRINLMIPVEEVIAIEEANDGSTEITFKSLRA